MFRLPLVWTFLLLFAAPVFSQERTGLELLILANSVDDEEVIKDARAYFDSPANKAVIEKCQKDGLSPPEPRAPDSDVPTKYQIDLGRDRSREAAHRSAKKAIERIVQKLQAAGDEKAERTALKELEAEIQRLKATFPVKSVKSVVTYRWVELGLHELRALNLDNAAAEDSERDATWKKAQLSRDKATTLPESFNPNSERRLLQGALFFSRECKNRNLSLEERGKIKMEYFVLARNPEIDPKKKSETAPLGSKHIVKITLDKSDDPPVLTVQLNQEGGQLLAALTAKNVSTNAGTGPKGTVFLDEYSISRHLAIIFDGKVLITPTINSQVTGGRFMIAGAFTQKDLEELAANLRLKK